VVPTCENEHYNFTKGALAACWISENDPLSAATKASFFISKDNWEIEGIDTSPIEVTEDNFQNRDIGLEQYQKAKKDGIAIFYAAWSRDGKTEYGPFTMKQDKIFDIGNFLGEQKKNKTKREMSAFRCK